MRPNSTFAINNLDRMLKLLNHLEIHNLRLTINNLDC